jgi:hypothetical protein
MPERERSIGKRLTICNAYDVILIKLKRLLLVFHYGECGHREARDLNLALLK